MHLQRVIVPIVLITGFFGNERISADPSYRIAAFHADVTVPIGHGMMGGKWLSESVADPLEAQGVVLWSDTQKPIVLVSVDWCEIRNDAYAQWQTMLAQAAGTDSERVLVTAIHQHDAPVADLGAEQILRAQQAAGTVCDVAFHRTAVDRVAAALKECLAQAVPVTHVGMGQGRVEQIASNRRYRTPSGEVRFDRMSSTRSPLAQEADEGLIDPWLKTLSFWRGDQPIAAIHFYAVHPMSYYGGGEVSADFPGIARRRRQAEQTGVAQIYCSGCSGNLTAGRYNDGDPANRLVLANRLLQAMRSAWADTRRVPLTRMDFRATPLWLEARQDEAFSHAGLTRALSADDPFQQCLAAMGLSWRSRLAKGIPITVPAIHFDEAIVTLLPGEVYVEFQLAAQRMRPDAFVCVAGYGDAATGYVPTEQHVAEGDTNLRDWCWVDGRSEPRVLEALRTVLATP